MVFDLTRMSLNSEEKMEISVEHIGRKGYPILIVDNFYRDPEYVMQVAMSIQYYYSMGDYHLFKLGVYEQSPMLMAQIGVDQSPISDFLYRHWASHYIDSFEKLQLSEHTTSLFGTIKTADEAEGVYGFRPRDIGVLLYGVMFLSLFEKESEGIGFYRNRDVDIEEIISLPLLASLEEKYPQQDPEIIKRVCEMGIYDRFRELQDEGKVEDYLDLLAWVYEVPPSELMDKMIEKDRMSDRWEQYSFVEKKFNRLVAFPGFLLHSMEVNCELGAKESEFENLHQFFMYPWTPVVVNGRRVPLQ
ncbi:MAG: hypothetical protein ACI9S8_001149 [Chlamydiales bacterium]